MTMIYSIHKPNSLHLRKVTDEMRLLGAPTLSVYDAGDYLIALEGSHRLAAAAALNLPVNIVVLDDDDVIDNDDEIEHKRVGDLVEWITSGIWPMDSVAYEIDTFIAA